MKTQKTQKTQETQNTQIKTQQTHFLFHVGRGGQRTFVGDFVSYDKAVRYIDSRATMFESNRDKKGRFCKKYFCDQSGSIVAVYGDMVFDFDGTYNMFQIVPTERIDSADLALILTERGSK